MIVAIVTSLLIFGAGTMIKVLSTVLLTGLILYVIIATPDPPPTPRPNDVSPIEYEAYSKEIFEAVAEISDSVYLQAPLSYWNIYTLHGSKAILFDNEQVFRFHVLCKPKMEIDIRKVHKLLQLSLGRRFSSGHSIIKTKKNHCIRIARIFTDGDILEIQVFRE